MSGACCGDCQTWRRFKPPLRQDWGYCPRYDIVKVEGERMCEGEQKANDRRKVKP